MECWYSFKWQNDTVSNDTKLLFIYLQSCWKGNNDNDSIVDHAMLCPDIMKYCLFGYYLY